MVKKNIVHIRGGWGGGVSGEGGLNPSKCVFFFLKFPYSTRRLLNTIFDSIHNIHSNPVKKMEVAQKVG